MLLHLTISMLDDKQFGINAKRLKLLEELRKKITILKPDKGQDIALLKHKDYTSCCKLIEVSWSVSIKIQNNETQCCTKLCQ